ncbi:helix-turn-helix domain-containing protein [Macrococcoides caseolyticum]|uniref:helix-turn-helix domain-containing protein n=1 Tax=Macrococcoides caseolyticum TaxID=69966 RepID=UPI0012FE9F6C|nr:helix-turn-helix transcriptional regulator [Macrococcus caseolyticus]
MAGSLGKRIKTNRLKKGYSQKEFADIIGVSNVVLSRYESDVRTPDFEKLKQIADILEVSTDYLLGREVDGLDSFMLNHAEGFSDLSEEEQKRIEQSLIEQAEFLIAKAKKNK